MIDQIKKDLEEIKEDFGSEKSTNFLFYGICLFGVFIFHATLLVVIAFNHIELAYSFKYAFFAMPIGLGIVISSFIGYNKKSFNFLGFIFFAFVGINLLLGFFEYRLIHFLIYK